MNNYDILIKEIELIASDNHSKNHSEIIAFITATIICLDHRDIHLNVSDEIRDLILFYLNLIRARNLTHKQRSILANQLLKQLKAKSSLMIDSDWENIPF